MSLNDVERPRIVPAAPALHPGPGPAREVITISQRLTLCALAVLGYVLFELFSCDNGFAVPTEIGRTPHAAPRSGSEPLAAAFLVGVGILPFASAHHRQVRINLEACGQHVCRCAWVVFAPLVTLRNVHRSPTCPEAESVAGPPAGNRTASMLLMGGTRNHQVSNPQECSEGAPSGQRLVGVAPSPGPRGTSASCSSSSSSWLAACV